MAFDSIVMADDKNLKKVLGQKLPVVLLLLEGSQKNKPVEDALNRAARKYQGEFIGVCVDVSENPRTLEKYGNLETPALVTLTKAFFGRKVWSEAEAIRPRDLRAHIDYLLDRGPEPAALDASEDNDQKKGGSKPVTDASFRKEVLKSKVPVLVDFWAQWCGPCLAVAPFMDEMAREYQGRVKIVKLDVDHNQVMSLRYQVQSIPTLIMFHGGQPIERRSGGNPRIIKDMIEEALLGT
jgi:thioredoxin 1